jgi:hypothetical protein
MKNACKIAPKTGFVEQNLTPFSFNFQGQHTTPEYLNRMKKIIYAIVFLLPASLFAQSGSANLSGKDINLRLSADGIMSWDGKNAHFEVPAGSGRNTLSSASLWIGGLDKNHNLHLSAQTYRESGSDFFPGPLDTKGQISQETSDKYNHVWKISRLQVDSFLSGASVPNAVLNWPDGAPFVDMDHNGTYEPLKGDYPEVQGDEMVWWVMNDALRPHSETGGLPMGIEVQATAWTFQCDNPALRSTVMLRYRIINRSAQQYDSVYAGLWADFDIGNLFDDYIGSNPELNAFFAYNGDANDNDTTITSKSGSYTYKGYGKKMPAQGISFVEGIKGDNGLEMPMSKFIYYNNDISVTGNPKVAGHFYNYLRGIWIDNTPLTTGKEGIYGQEPTNYAFPGMPDDGSAWTEASAGNVPGDRRGLGSFGPFTLKAGGEKEFTAAFVYAQAANGLSALSVSQMLGQIRDVNRLYHQNALQGCTGISTCMGDSCVWPGDADRNGVAEMSDIFRIGYAYGSKGQARKMASTSWKPQHGTSWGQTFPDGTDYHYADANGDGRVDSLDVLPIVWNYGYRHSKTEAEQSQTAGNPELRLHIMEDSVMAGGVVHGEIILGSKDLPAEDVYGIVLRILFDSNLIVPGTFSFDLSGSGLGDPNEIVVAVSDKDGFTDLGITRNDQKGRTTDDVILRWKYVIVGDVAGNHQDAKFKMDVTETRDPALKIITTDNSDDMVVITAHSTGIYSPEALDAMLKAYPNPAGNVITVDAGRLKLQGAEVLNMQGQVVERQVATGHTVTLDTHSLAPGMYMIRIQTTEGTAVKKFIRAR